MTLTAGTRLGPYEIASPIGAGGMGEVYKARDTRLDRTVAIKILSADFGSSASVKERFEREAKMISQLNHPNICVLHDVGNEAGVDYLVMEYLEGESLADRIAKGPLPVDQALHYGIEIADALDKAHRQGIFHRDLKPGNVMLTKSGAKLLDFGLAKLGASPKSPLEGLTTLPTEHKPLTQEGTILGTFQYMAPEQLEGLDADARTDIFALGCLLYEVATGRRAFAGKSRASLIAAILGSEPQSITQLQPLTPPAFEHVIERCLEKDPDDRWQSARDVAEELRWISQAGSQAGVAAPLAMRRKTRERLAWWLQPVVALAAIAATWGVIELRRERPVVYSEINPPENHSFAFFYGPAGISPDGQKVAFLAAPEDGGKRILWVRPLGSPSAQPLPGTEDATHPFWSPDSKQIAFFASGKLKKIDAAGGPAQALCDASRGFGGSWGSSGVILFSADAAGTVMRVSSGGGIATPATKLDESQKETSHRFPSFLPDGRHFIFLALSRLTTDTDTLVVASLDSTARKTLLKTQSTVFYSPTGHLLYWRDGTLVAQPFDADALDLTGEIFPVADEVVKQFRFVIASVSQNGTLAYQSGSSAENSQLVWLDREGKQTGVVGKPADYLSPALSHDETRIAVEIVDSANDKSDIWILDQLRGTSMRLTFDAANERVPQWTADDGRVLFTSDRNGGGDILAKRSAGIGTDEEYLMRNSSLALSDVSLDGNLIFFGELGSKTDWDIWMYSPREKKASVFIQTPYFDATAKVSPDSRFVAYMSAESGITQVYVQDLAGEGGKWQISTDGGTYPRWRRDGKELFFMTLVANEPKLMAVDVSTSPTFSAGIPKELFVLPIKRVRNYQYDVSADGKKFLVNSPVEEKSATSLTLVQNWIGAVKQ